MKIYTVTSTQSDDYSYTKLVKSFTTLFEAAAYANRIRCIFDRASEFYTEKYNESVNRYNRLLAEPSQPELIAEMIAWDSKSDFFEGVSFNITESDLVESKLTS